MTEPQFLSYIRRRLKAGESYASIGESLGVSRQSVFQWLRDDEPTTPSATIIMLAERLLKDEKAA